MIWYTLQVTVIKPAIFTIFYCDKSSRKAWNNSSHSFCRFEPRNLQRVARSSRCSVSVWGALSKEGFGPLVRIEDRFNAAAYCDFIERVVVPYALNRPFPDGLYFLQQDRSPIHMAKSTTHMLEQLGVMLWEWPPQGTDMNICENVWGAMKKALSRQPIQRGSQDMLWAAVKQEWEPLRANDLVTRFFDSLSRRMGVVVAEGGEFTKY